MKAYQRIIREQEEKNEKGQLSLIKTKPDRVDIKKAIVKEVSYNTAKKIILKYEWLGTMVGTSKHYGIFFDGYLGGVVCYGHPTARMGYGGYVGDKYASFGIQLSRGACVYWAHEHSASKLIGASLKILKNEGYKYAVAFSDPAAGEVGTVYQATNWYYTGIERERRRFQIVYKHTGKLYLSERHFHKKHGYKNLESFLSENPGLIFVKGHEKAKYIKLIGSKTENKEMMKTLRGRIKPYPKRN